jgi:hypothetical protein
VNIFVFLGPTLPHKDAQEILGAQYLGPAAMGDVYRLVQTQAWAGDCIAIVDGLFEQVPAVWHKEILYALSKGVHVFGASSMGALRAAELHAFGMRGVGRIFEAYRDRVVEDDDEVVVAHATAEQGYRPLSHAMISLRFGLQEILRDGLLNQDEYEALVGHSKAAHYSERSWLATIAQARALGVGADTMAALKDKARRFDAKASDARDLLTLLARKARNESTAFQPNFVLEQTTFWVGLMRSQAASISEQQRRASTKDKTTDREVLRRLRALHPDRETLLRQALLMRLAGETTQGWTPSAKHLVLAAQRIASRNRIRSDQELLSWRQEQGIDREKWRDLLDMEARCEALVQRFNLELNPYLIAVLKRSGLYSALCDEVSASWATLTSLGLQKLSLEDAGIDAETLQSWYERRFGRMHPDPEQHAQDLGFESLREFVTELLAAFMMKRADATTNTKFRKC